MRHPVVRVLFALVWVVLLAFFVAKSFDLVAIRQSFSNLFWPWVFLSLTLDLLCLFAKSQAWREVLLGLKPLARLEAFRVYLVGAMLNQVLPLRGGDLGRSELLGRRYDVPRLQGLSTAVVESLLNGLTLVPILLGALVFFPLDDRITTNLLIFCGAICLILTIVALVARRYRYTWLEGFGVFRDRKRIQKAALFYGLAWLIYLTSLRAMMASVGIDVTFWAAPVMAVFLAASMALPAPPGRLGVFEGSVVLALALFGVSKETALTFGLVLHAAQTLPTLAWGTLAAWTINSEASNTSQAAAVSP